MAECVNFLELIIVGIRGVIKHKTFSKTFQGCLSDYKGMHWWLLFFIECLCETDVHLPLLKFSLHSKLIHVNFNFDSLPEISYCFATPFTSD